MQGLGARFQEFHSELQCARENCPRLNDVFAMTVHCREYTSMVTACVQSIAAMSSGGVAIIIDNIKADGAERDADGDIKYIDDTL